MAEKALEHGLLPEGLRDALPPEAQLADALEHRLLKCFTSHGYDPVRPPLIEFEQSLTGRLEGSARLDMFRLLDPESQRIMVLRSDITGQVARIATTRLGHVERPLRLCYSGIALKVKGSQLRPERQFGQAGIELIGPRTLEAALEVVLLSHEALAMLGIEAISIDLVFPRFVPQLAEELNLNPKNAALVRDALDARDIGRLTPLNPADRHIFEAILNAAGTAQDAVTQLKKLDFPEKSAVTLNAIDEFVQKLGIIAPEISVTIDPGEQRDFSYQGDFGFSLFAVGNKVELGRGGRYGILKPDGDIEPATGFTLYLDSLCRCLAPLPVPDKILLPFDLPRPEAAKLRESGWVTVQSLAPNVNLRDEARRLGCKYFWHDGKIQNYSA